MAEKWISKAIKNPGALRRKAKAKGLVKGEETLSATDLAKLEGGADTTTKRQINLARTLRKMKKKG